MDSKDNIIVDRDTYILLYRDELCKHNLVQRNVLIILIVLSQRRVYTVLRYVHKLFQA